MRETLEEYGLFIFRGVIAMILIVVLFSLPNNEKMQKFFPEFDTISSQGDNKDFKAKTKPVLEIDDIIVLNKNSTFDHTKYVKNAYIVDEEGNSIDLTNEIVVFYEKEEDRNLNTVDTSITGSRQVKYVLLYGDFTVVVPQVVVVKNLEVN